MTDKIAKPVNGSYGVVDGVKITEDVVARLVKNAEDGFPGATFRASGCDHLNVRANTNGDGVGE